MNESTAKKYAQLLDRLYRMTTAKAIQWTLDQARRPRCEIAGYVVRLYEGNSGGTNVMEYISLSDAFDNFIEVVSDEDLIDITPKFGPHETYYSLMDDLRTHAFRQAVGADRALDDILRKLGDDF